MNTFYSDNKGGFRTGDIELFLEIAIDNHLTLRRIIEEYHKLKECKTTYHTKDRQDFENINIEHLDRLFHLENERFKHEINGILALSTFYEGLINEIGIVEFGCSYFKKHIDKLSILSKWEIVLKLIYHRAIPRESQLFQKMREVIQARNHLSHYKTKEASFENDQTDTYYIVLADALKELKNLINFLKSLNDEKTIYNFLTIDKQMERLTQ